MNYPTLELLLKAYLTLDWPDDYPSPMAAVDDFIASEPTAGRLLQEISLLLAEQKSEADLYEFVMTELGSGYVPDSDGLTMTDWLIAVSNRVSAASG